MQPSVSELFNRIAPVYDRLNDQLSFGLHHVWKYMAVRWSNPPVGGCCLDVCCGSGDLSRRLAQFVGLGGRVYGLDLAAKLLAVAARSSDRYPMIEWRIGDALDLPFEAEFFDAATMGYGLRNVGNIPRALEELRRVLKTGAKAAILDFHRPSQPLLQAWQDWYLERVVVSAAAQLGCLEEYAYIQDSLARFPGGLAQVQLAEQAGFGDAVHYPIAAGMMGVLVVTK